MDTITLEVQPRDKSVLAKNLLKNDLLPIEYYGKGVDNQSFQIDYQTFRRAFRTAGTNTVLELDAGGKKINAIVHHVQYHPVTDKMMHVDLKNVRMDVAITAKVPLEFVGVAPAIAALGGNLNANLHEVEIKCLPKDLLHNIEVNIESLEDYTSAVRIKDIVVPDAVELMHEEEELVVAVIPPAAEEPEPVEGEEGAEGEGAEGGEAAEGGEKAEGSEEKSEEKSE